MFIISNTLNEKNTSPSFSDSLVLLPTRHLVWRPRQFLHVAPCGQRRHYHGRPLVVGVLLLGAGGARPRRLYIHGERSIQTAGE